MTKYKNELVIDFGDVGYRNSREPFKVRLKSSGLSALIEASVDAQRVYELYLIDRPGDVWDYVCVIVEAAPARVAEGIKHELNKLKVPLDGELPATEHPVPFPVFDQMFYWAWDDTDPADEAWLSHRDSKAMRNYATQLLSMVREAQSRLGWNDHLLRHIVSTIKAGTHSYSYLSREVAVAKSSSEKSAESEHTELFYQKLRDLVRDPDLGSIAYRGNGDYKLLRMMATEQRRRANRTQHAPGYALYLSALVNHKANNAAWDSEIHYFDEGLAHGDLFIQGVGMVGGASIKALVEVHQRTDPGRYILSIKDEGDIAGFDKAVGDGWVLYTKQQAFDRRKGLDYIETRRTSKLGPVLAFADIGGTLFDFDKTFIVVGEAIDAQTREALAVVMAEWEAKNGDPLLVAFGDRQPFELAGCRRIFTPPATGMAEAEKANWLSDLIRIERPWIDAIISLDAPRWVESKLRQMSEITELPWQPWVVCSKATKELKASMLIDGDLSTAIRAAHMRAKSHR